MEHFSASSLLTTLSQPSVMKLSVYPANMSLGTHIIIGLLTDDDMSPRSVPSVFFLSMKMSTSCA
eukprot:scaffold168246_cov18-Prasinocladus_malaysianus.AAC.1